MGPDQPHLELIDQLVESALSQASTHGSLRDTPPMLARIRLHLQMGACPRHLAGLPRDLAQIDNSLRNNMRAVAKAQAPWPLFIHGPVGTGKTCAALCLLDHCIGGGEYFTEIGLWKRLLFAETGRLVQSGEFGQVDSVLWPETIWRSLRRTWLVVLDEVGSRGQVSDALYDCTKEVLEVRLNKPLIMISNFGLERIAEIYDDRIASRLAAGTVVEVKGKDRRIEL